MDPRLQPKTATEDSRMHMRAVLLIFKDCPPDDAANTCARKIKAFLERENHEEAEILAFVTEARSWHRLSAPLTTGNDHHGFAVHLIRDDRIDVDNIADYLELCWPILAKIRPWAGPSPKSWTPQSTKRSKIWLNFLCFSAFFSVLHNITIFPPRLPSSANADPDEPRVQTITRQPNPKI